MSVFRVNLDQGNQGDLDSTVSGASIQRTVYVPGPDRINRELKDGATFTDCNYWKRFAYPQMPYDQAFITVVSDDGSIWSDIPGENISPKVYEVSIAEGSTYNTGYTAGGGSAGNTINILEDTGGYAVFTYINNLSSGSGSIKVRLNGTAVFNLAEQTGITFNPGDLVISKIEFDNSASGATSNLTVQVICGVQIIPSS